MIVLAPSAVAIIGDDGCAADAQTVLAGDVFYDDALAERMGVDTLSAAQLADAVVPGLLGLPACRERGELLVVEVGRRDSGDFNAHVRDFVAGVEQAQGVAAGEFRFRELKTAFEYSRQVYPG